MWNRATDKKSSGNGSFTQTLEWIIVLYICWMQSMIFGISSRIVCHSNGSTAANWLEANDQRNIASYNYLLQRDSKYLSANLNWAHSNAKRSFQSQNAKRSMQRLKQKFVLKSMRLRLETRIDKISPSGTSEMETNSVPTYFKWLKFFFRCFQLFGECQCFENPLCQCFLCNFHSITVLHLIQIRIKLDYNSGD